MALLDAIERAISISGSKFQAEEIGQMTFFDNQAGLTQKIHLMEVDPNYNRREQLNWERELVGLYVSDHPLRETGKALEGIVSHFSSELIQAEKEEFVRVFGEVVRIAKIMTKKGDEMAFVRLEDVRGFTKLVLFPEIWKRFSGALNYGRVVIAEGKVDTSRGEPNVLVDNIRVEVQLDEESIARLKRAIEMDNGRIPTGKLSPKSTQTNYSQPDQTMVPEEKIQSEQGATAVEEAEKTVKTVEADVPEQKTGTPVPSYLPEPDFPPDLDYLEQPTEREIMMSEPHRDYLPEPIDSSETEEAGEQDTPEQIEERSSVSPVEEIRPEQPVVSSGPMMDSTPAVQEDTSLEPEVIPPALKPVVADEVRKTPQMLTVVMRSLGDKERDILRMRRVYGMLISDPGPDRFAFYVIERSRGYRLEFPSDTTSLNDDLRARLEKLMGKENIILEPITIQ
jgi:DNA polymerase-3 subunit alpha